MEAYDIKVTKQKKGKWISTALVREKRPKSFAVNGEATINISTISEIGETKQESLNALEKELKRKNITFEKTRYNDYLEG